MNALKREEPTIRTLKTKSPENVGFQQYHTLCKACEVDDFCFVDEWYSFSGDERKQIVLDTIDKGIMNKVNNILKGGA